jgi:glutamine synthetase
MKTKLEYIWLDGYEPEPNLRSKVKIVDDVVTDVNDVPLWNFDGSSTKQAEGSKSDCILKPVRIYTNNTKTEKYPTIYVFCEVMNSNMTPHSSNQRHLLGEEETDFWVGFEQEYFIREGKNKPILGFGNGFPEPQGKYYCGVGGNVLGRHLVEEHLELCLDLGIQITGTNAEVALGQWEFQVFSKGKLKSCDDLWMTRYLMDKLSEKYGYYIEYHPKPLGNTDWNGSGLHTNFSTNLMRNEGGKEYFKALFNAFELRHEVHIENYGSDNNLRLTGKHETQSIHKFSWGVSDRGASIRVPQKTSENWKGYIEDRRPASNGNPYQIIKVIVDAIKMTGEIDEVKKRMNTNVSYKELGEIEKKFKASSDFLNEYKEETN